MENESEYDLYLARESALLYATTKLYLAIFTALRKLNVNMSSHVATGAARPQRMYVRKGARQYQCPVWIWSGKRQEALSDYEVLIWRPHALVCFWIQIYSIFMRYYLS